MFDLVFSFVISKHGRLSYSLCDWPHSQRLMALQSVKTKNKSTVFVMIVMQSEPDSSQTPIPPVIDIYEARWTETNKYCELLVTLDVQYSQYITKILKQKNAIKTQLQRAYYEKLELIERVNERRLNEANCGKAETDSSIVDFELDGNDSNNWNEIYELNQANIELNAKTKQNKSKSKSLSNNANNLTEKDNRNRNGSEMFDSLYFIKEERTSNVEIEENIDIGIKAFECNVCKKYFETTELANKHVLEMHLENNNNNRDSIENIDCGIENNSSLILNDTSLPPNNIDDNDNKTRNEANSDVINYFDIDEM